MSAGDYLKVAASQLRRAASESQQEANNKGKEMVYVDKDTSKKVDELTGRMRNLQRELNSTDDPDGKQRILATIGLLQKEINDAKKEHDQVKQQLAQEASQKQAQVGQLNQQAQSIEQQASQM